MDPESEWRWSSWAYCSNSAHESHHDATLSINLLFLIQRELLYFHNDPRNRRLDDDEDQLDIPALNPPWIHWEIIPEFQQYPLFFIQRHLLYLKQFETLAWIHPESHTWIKTISVILHTEKYFISETVRNTCLNPPWIHWEIIPEFQQYPLFFIQRNLLNQKQFEKTSFLV